MRQLYNIIKGNRGHIRSVLAKFCNAIKSHRVATILVAVGKTHGLWVPCWGTALAVKPYVEITRQSNQTSTVANTINQKNRCKGSTAKAVQTFVLTNPVGFTHGYQGCRHAVALNY